MLDQVTLSLFAPSCCGRPLRHGSCGMLHCDKCRRAQHVGDLFAVKARVDTVIEARPQGRVSPTWACDVRDWRFR